MELKELMAAFCGKAGIDPVVPNEIGAYELTAGETAFSVIASDERGEAALFVAEVGPRPNVRAGELAELLLGVNYLFSATGGATIAYEPSQQRYMLQREVPLVALSVDDFVAALDAFVTKADELRMFLTQADETLEAVDEAATEETAMGSVNFMQV